MINEKELPATARLLDHYISCALVTAKLSKSKREEGDDERAVRLKNISAKYMMKARMLQNIWSLIMTNQERLHAILLNQMVERRMKFTGEGREQAMMHVKRYICQHLAQK